MSGPRVGVQDDTGTSSVPARQALKEPFNKALRALTAGREDHPVAHLEPGSRDERWKILDYPIFHLTGIIPLITMMLAV